MATSAAAPLMFPVTVLHTLLSHLCQLVKCFEYTRASSPSDCQVVLNPVLKKLEVENPDAVHILRRAFAKADQVPFQAECDRMRERWGL